MLMDHPSFCKYLSNQDYIDKILIPPDFMKEHKKMLAKTCLLKTETGGRTMSWEAKLVRDKSNNNFFICEGDWPQFVVYHKLELGDILLFLLIDKYTFRIVPYIPKSCTMHQLSFEELSSSSDDEDQDFEKDDGSKDPCYSHSVGVSKKGQGTVDRLNEISSSMEGISVAEEKKCVMEQTLKIQEKTKDITSLLSDKMKEQALVQPQLEVEAAQEDLEAARLAAKRATSLRVRGDILTTKISLKKEKVSALEKELESFEGLKDALKMESDAIAAVADAEERHERAKENLVVAKRLMGAAE